MSQKLKLETTFTLVEFILQEKVDKKSVEIVPTSWISKTTKDAFICKFPDVKDYKYLDAWVQGVSDPSTAWQDFPVLIAANANSEKQNLQIVSPTMELSSSEEELESRYEQSESKKRKTSSENESPLKKLPTEENKKDETQLNYTATQTLAKQIVEMIKLSEERIIAHFNKKLVSLQRRIQYDITHTTKDILQAIKLAAVPSAIKSFLDAENLPLPVDTVENFSVFEEDLKLNEKTRFGLKTHILQKIAATNDMHEAIKTLMPILIKKEVQTKYSGKGKAIRGVAKLDFSSTNTYLCIKEAVTFKFKSIKEGEISSAIGIWLSQSVDRERGRKEREIKKNVKSKNQEQNSGEKADIAEK